ncbi:MAG: hypothetical protein JOZ41_06925 [Chloroflexi bacterium]|nr:hypothetical protein [Chloroflexota bacterium]
MNGAPDQVTIIARRTLLDVLEVLDAHRRSVILVGAQAIYLHTGESEFAVAQTTTDADLALDPRNLAPEPQIERLMRDHGFDQDPNWPGVRRREGASPVDFLVPEALAGKGRRSAKLETQGKRLALRAVSSQAAAPRSLP